jgi:hypothetical protein
MTPTVEQAIEIVRQLPPPDREKVRDWIEEENQKIPDKENKQEKMKQDQERFRRSMNWIHENREEFDGQWVALDGDTLLAHGTDGKKVHAEAQKKGVKNPLMHRVSIKGTQPFGGW